VQISPWRGAFREKKRIKAKIITLTSGKRNSNNAGNEKKSDRRNRTGQIAGEGVSWEGLEGKKMANLFQKKSDRGKKEDGGSRFKGLSREVCFCLYPSKRVRRLRRGRGLSFLQLPRDGKNFDLHKKSH